jgi:hypothetical protein
VVKGSVQSTDSTNASSSVARKTLGIVAQFKCNQVSGSGLDHTAISEWIIWGGEDVEKLRAICRQALPFFAKEHRKVR